MLTLEAQTIKFMYGCRSAGWLTLQT